jgi:hypothetical protein
LQNSLEDARTSRRGDVIISQRSLHSEWDFVKETPSTVLQFLPHIFLNDARSVGYGYERGKEQEGYGEEVTRVRCGGYTLFSAYVIAQRRKSWIKVGAVVAAAPWLLRTSTLQCLGVRHTGPV